MVHNNKSPLEIKMDAKINYMGLVSTDEHPNLMFKVPVKNSIVVRIDSQVERHKLANIVKPISIDD